MTKPPTADDIAKRLGMSSSNLSSFKHGHVVTEERDSSNEKDLCLLVATTVPADIEKSWDFVQAEKVTDVQDATLAHGHIDTKTFSLEGFTFEHGSKSHITDYAMSKDESKKVSHAHDKEAAFREVLSARAKKYWEHGIKGIEPYEGKRHDITGDLEAANQADLRVILDPVLREEMEVVPSKSKHPELHSLVWTITKGNDMTSIVLSHRILYKKEGVGFIVIRRKFYSGCDFDASQIAVGVLPTSEHQSAIFYVNHTYTAAVAGFGGGVKRSVGRKLMKEKLVATMEKAQKALAK